MARVTLRSRLLILSSLVLLLATLFYVRIYGEEVYFLVFHRPFHVQLTSNSLAYVAPVLPVFEVNAVLADPEVPAGGTEHITVSVRPNVTTTGYLEVWVTAPNNRQVFQSPAHIDSAYPVTFSAAHTQTYNYAYAVPDSAPSGTYRVSELITAADQKTDYQLHEEFASFTVQ